jgi:hypothetical protein
MLGVIMFTVFVMMSRLMMVVSGRMVVRSGQMMVFVRGMFSHFEISIIVDDQLQSTTNRLPDDNDRSCLIDHLLAV